MPSVQDQVDTFELLNKEVTERLNRLAASGNQLDTKAALLAGVAATATQFLATRPETGPVLAMCAFIMFAASFALALAAHAATRHHDVPELAPLLRWTNTVHAEVLARLLATRVEAFRRNKRRHRWKAALWWCCVAAPTTGLILSTLAIVHTAQP